MVGTLAFRPLKKEDEGRYLCRAHNDVGNDTKELDVEVLGTCSGIFLYINSYCCYYDYYFACEISVIPQEIKNCLVPINDNANNCLVPINDYAYSWCFFVILIIIN